MDRKTKEETIDTYLSAFLILTTSTVLSVLLNWPCYQRDLVERTWYSYVHIQTVFSKTKRLCNVGRTKTATAKHGLCYVGLVRVGRGCVLPLSNGRACSSASCVFRYLELPCDFLVFFLRDRFANGSILSTIAVVDIVSK